MHPILQEIQSLPPQDQQQIVNLVSTLLKKRQQRWRSLSEGESTYIRQRWMGALRDDRATYTSLSLQQETVNYWTNDVFD